MHYAWIIVAITFGAQFAANAMGFYAFGVVLGPIAEEFEATRTGVALVPAALSWAGFVVGPLIGGAMYAISPAALGLVGGGIMIAAGMLMVYVEWRVRPEVLSGLGRS